MFWPGFAMVLVASLCGVAAVGRWRRAQIPPWQGMGFRADRRAWADAGAGVAIGALAMGGVLGVEWALGVLRVRGVQAPDLG